MTFGVSAARVVELVVDRATHPHPEEPGDARRQGDLVGRGRMGQPPGQHGQRVLAVERTVDAARDRVGEEGVVDAAVHHRVGVQSGEGRTRTHARQVLHLGDERGVRGGDVDHDIAGADRLQVAPVGRLGPAGAGQGSHRNGAEQAGEEDHHQRRAPRRPPGGPPPVPGHRHRTLPPHAPRYSSAPSELMVGMMNGLAVTSKGGTRGMRGEGNPPFEGRGACTYQSATPSGPGSLSLVSSWPSS